MKRERWLRVQELFQHAAQLAQADVPRYLDQTCEGDHQLRSEVESLLQYSAESDDALLPPTQTTSFTQLVGQSVGPFTLTRVIASGGMGTVYEARQQSPSRTVALKVLQPHIATPDTVRRFQFEAEVLGHLQHRNIAQVHQSGTHEIHGLTLPYFAMEFISNARSITEYATEESIDVRARIELIARVCDAVHAAHQKSVIHRDLKPQNILVDQHGEPKVIDFGIARATNSDLSMTQQTQPGQVIGTAQYMSPEQYVGRSDQLDVRSDVYALGVVLYELLAGRLPYETKSTTLASFARVVQEEEPTRLSSAGRHLRGEIETVVGKAMEKQREQRYQSASELAADLRRVLRNEPIQARPASMLYWAKKYVVRRRWQALAIAAGALAIVVAGGMFAWQRISVAQSEALAKQQNYGPTMAAVEAAIQQGDSASARRLLDYARAQHNDLLGWEWRHLDHLVDQSQFSIDRYTRTVHNKAAVSERGILATPASSGVVLLHTDDLREVGRIPTPISGQRCEFVALNIDGDLLAFATKNGNEGFVLELWDISEPSTPRCAATWMSTLQISALAFHPYYPLLACGAGVPQQHAAHIELWQLTRDRDGEYLVSEPQHLEGHFGHISELAFSPDGTLMASSSWDHTLRLWQIDKAWPLASEVSSVVLRGHEDDVQTVAFDATGQWLASGAGDSVVRIWDIEQCLRGALPTGTDSVRSVIGRPENSVALLGHQGNVIDLAFDPQETRLYSGGNDRFVHCWELREDKPLTDSIGSGEWAALQYRETQRLHGHGNQIESVNVAAQGEVITMSRQGRFRKWLPGLPKLPILKGHTTSVRGVTFHPDNEHLISSSKSEFIVWDAETCVPVARRVVCLPNNVVENVICWTDQDRVLLALSPPDPRCSLVWDVTDPANPKPTQPAVLADTNHLIKSVAVSANGQRLTAISADGKLHNFRMTDGRFERDTTHAYRLPARPTHEMKFSLAFLDDDGDWLALAVSRVDNKESGHSAGLAIIRSGQDMPQDWHIRDPGIMCLDRKGDLLAGGSRQDTVFLWKIERSRAAVALRAMHRFDGHSGQVTAVRLHSTEPRLITGGIDSILKTWNTDSGSSTGTLRGELGTPGFLAFDVDGQRMAIASHGSLGAGNVVYLRETSAMSVATAHRRRNALRAYDAVRFAFRLPAESPNDIRDRIQSFDLPAPVLTTALDNFEVFASHAEYLLPEAVRHLVGNTADIHPEHAASWLNLIREGTSANPYTETIRGAILLRIGRHEEANSVLADALAEWDAPPTRIAVGGFDEPHLQCVAWLALAKTSVGARGEAEALLRQAEKMTAELPSRPTRETIALIDEVKRSLAPTEHTSSVTKGDFENTSSRKR